MLTRVIKLVAGPMQDDDAPDEVVGGFVFKFTLGDVDDSGAVTEREFRPWLKPWDFLDYEDFVRGVWSETGEPFVCELVEAQSSDVAQRFAWTSHLVNAWRVGKGLPSVAMPATLRPGVSAQFDSLGDVGVRLQSIHRLQQMEQSTYIWDPSVQQWRDGRGNVVAGPAIVEPPGGNTE